AERHFKSRKYSPSQVEENFFQMMCNLEFLPNSPVLMNAATAIGQLAACFVLPVEDSMEDIFNSLKCMAIIHQTGGGTGFNFSHLRPKGDLVYSTKGEASGVVSFMEIFDTATGVIVQGGRRRGANMGILRCDHPDIVDFIQAKSQEARFSNFNLSVGVTDAFMEAVKKNKYYDLINPRNNKVVRRVSSRGIFDLIIDSAWRTGDPGLIFLDEINRHNPLPALGRIEATNPCGEVPLLPYESCVLASLNLSKFVKNGSLDWDALAGRVKWGIRFLDNIIEVNKFPLAAIKDVTSKNRKIGLGVMGFADMLILLGIPYNSPQAVKMAEDIMCFIHLESQKASNALARERGVFPNFKYSLYAKKGLLMRNATVNTVAPTGSISIIAGCSSGIEPLFAVSFVRNVLSGVKLFESNPYFEEISRKRGFYSKELMMEIAKRGSIQNIKFIPPDIRRLFVTAFDISALEHLKIQAAFQKFCDNSVSKTINLAAESTVEDIRKIYMLAYKLRCKGITVYRYGTKKEQVLTLQKKERLENLVSVDAEYSGGCLVRACTP
ncbi:MAG: adenosylcobalamin-dependent ribonucleoside-diphosphate reductase, partial [Candidatus Omnitrophica bacterium]|nr:adenosylcobalamin-dependent ribonucleoside-diphosphate reductase [Candidatus Omnitrophota bacterium]